MEIEEEIVYKVNEQGTKELNSTFVIMLCVLFYCLFRILLGGLSQLFKIIIPDIAVSGIQLHYLEFVWFLWVFYGFWAIIRALKGADNTIFCLKLCLPFYFISFLFSSLSKLSTISFGSMLIPLLILFFPLIFFIYLCKSDDIKKIYPKERRKIGVSGFVGILLYALIAFFFTQAFISGASNAILGRKIDPTKIQLYDNELSDGRAIFKTRTEWQLDSIVEPGYLGKVYCFHDTKNQASIRVSCTREDYKPTRDNYIYSITEDCPFGYIPYIKAFNYKQVEADDAIIYVDQYKYEAESNIYYWTYASKLGKSNYKGVRLSIVEVGNCTTEIESVIDFMNNTTFDLRSRLFKKD